MPFFSKSWKPIIIEEFRLTSTKFVSFMSRGLLISSSTSNSVQSKLTDTNSRLGFWDKSFNTNGLETLTEATYSKCRRNLSLKHERSPSGVTKVQCPMLNFFRPKETIHQDSAGISIKWKHFWAKIPFTLQMESDPSSKVPTNPTSVSQSGAMADFQYLQWRHFTQDELHNPVVNSIRTSTEIKMV